MTAAQTGWERLQWIDARLGEIPHGQIFVEERKGRRTAWRIHKEGGRTVREPLGPEGGLDHRRALELLEERRRLSAERKQWWLHFERAAGERRQ